VRISSFRNDTDDGRRLTVWLLVVAVVLVQTASLAGSLPPLPACKGHGVAGQAAPQAHSGHGGGDGHLHQAASSRTVPRPACSELLCPECRALYAAHLLALPVPPATLPVRTRADRPGFAGHAYRAPCLLLPTPPPIASRPI